MIDRDDVLYLGSRYFELVARASRRDLDEASDFFGLPPGQASYAIGNLDAARLEDVCGYGLPYHVANQSLVLSHGVAEKASQDFSALAIAQLTGWRRDAFDLAVEHWSIVRGWARTNLSVAAALIGLRTHAEAQALRDLKSKWIRGVAAMSYSRLTMDASLGHQTAILLAEAESAPDRITVARCSSPLLAALA